MFSLSNKNPVLVDGINHLEKKTISGLKEEIRILCFVLLFFKNLFKTKAVDKSK
jgi:hypothetical protein